MRKRTIVLGLLGSTLDALGKGKARWNHWRPSVALCQHEDLLVDRFELLHSRRFTRLANNLTHDIATVSPETAVRKREIEFKDPWDFEEVYATLLDFARAYPFEPDAEDYLVHISTGTHVAQICLFLLTESRYIPARLLQTSPPRGEFRSGPGEYAVIDLDLSKYDLIASRFKQEQKAGLSFLKSGIDTRNAQFNRIVERIEKVVLNTRAPVLLMGPTGAGKSQIARRIHELKKTRGQVEGPFVEVNCATLRGEGAMSTLFGHVKGAFTGAMRDRPGLLRSADRGILFLDEVGELGTDEQAMLLRALEEKRFFPLGADSETGSDFQLIAGTNRDLEAAVRTGTFREDLLARINLWTFRLPGLRERPEDIEPNLQYEIDRLGSQGGAHITFNKEARELYVRFATSPEAVWSANFRDLGASVARMATLAEGGRITTAVAEEEIGRLKGSWRRGDDGEDSRDIVAEVLGRERMADIDRFDLVQLTEVIRVCRRSASLSEAGRILFAASRSRRKSTNDADRLRKYLARFEIGWRDVAADRHE